MLFLTGKMYAVYNPQQKKYLSRRRTTYSNWGWTDEFEWIHLYRKEIDAFAACDSDCQVVEVSLTMNGKVTTNIEQQRKQEFNDHMERFIELHKNPQLTSAEDVEYGQIRKRLRRLDSNRLNDLLIALKS